jgi:dolichol-phosphate mannosyltransferase
MGLSIILPTLNEAKNIERINLELKKFLKIDYEIIIVDDNSPDGTGRIADSLASNDKRISVIHRHSRLGLSSAIYEGFKKAKMEYILVMDADLSHPPQIISQLLKYIGKYDLVIGSRLIKGGNVENWRFRRKILSIGATLPARFLTKIKDPMSGFFIVKKHVIKDIRIKSKGYKILLEILVKGSYNSIKEVPYTFRGREYGQSKIGRNEIINYISDYFNLIKYKILKK